MGLPSPSGRTSAAIGSSGSPVGVLSGAIFTRSAGGKHSRSASPGSPPTITAMTGATRDKSATVAHLCFSELTICTVLPGTK
jgi:hypothetical protein